MANSSSAAATEPESDPEARPAGAERHGAARWVGWSIAAISMLVAVRLAIPWFLETWITMRLSSALGVAVAVDDVDLRLWAGEITVEGIHAAPPPQDSASSIDIASLSVGMGFRRRLRGMPFIDLRLSGVDVTLDLQRPWPVTRDAAERQGHVLHSVEVTDGHVAVVLDSDTTPVLELTDLHGSLIETSTGVQTDAMTAEYSIRAQTGEGGSLALDGAIAPLAPSSSWTLRLALERLELRRLNPLFEAVFEMDVEHGWFSLAGEVTVGLGHVRGRLRPRFEELELLGRGERRVRHPMAEALFSSMLSGADLPIDIDQAVALAGDSVLDNLAQIDGMAVLNQTILRGFVRRLDTLTDYEAKAGRIEVDFEGGRLSFFDVELNRSGGEIDRPFVAVERLDIVVEQSAVDHEVPTYKSITLHQPTLVFVTGATPQTSQLTFDPDWQKKVNVLPYPTDRLEIIDGRVEYRDDSTQPPTSLFVSNIQLDANGLGRARVDDSRRGATLHASARVMDLSRLTVDAELSPGVLPLDASVRLDIETLQLAQMNELLHGRFGIDISTGTMAVTAAFDVHDGQLRGEVSPVLTNVRVLGLGETELQHPLRELMLERRLRKLDGAALVLDYRIRFNLMRELPGALLSAALNAEPVPQPKKVRPAWMTRGRRGRSGPAELEAR